MYNYNQKEMKYMTLCMLALLALLGHAKLVVYGPQELIDEFNKSNGSDAKSKSLSPPV